MCTGYLGQIIKINMCYEEKLMFCTFCFLTVVNFLQDKAVISFFILILQASSYIVYLLGQKKISKEREFLENDKGIYR